MTQNTETEKAGRQSMSKGKELAKNTAIVAIGKISTQFLNFLFLPLYTAALKKAEFGTVDLFNSCVALLMPVMTLQSEQGIFRFLIDQRDSEEGRKKLISTIMGFLAGQTLVCIMAFLLVQNFLHIDYKIFLLLNLLAVSYSTVLLQVARGIGNNAAYAAASFTASVIAIVFNILLILVIPLGAGGMLAASLLGSLSSSAYLLYKLRLHKYISFCAFDKASLKEMLKYSVPLIPNAVSWWIVNASDRFIVTTFLGLDYTGLITIANKFPTVFASMYNILNMTWIENATLYMNKEGGEAYFGQMLNRLARIYTAVYLGITAAMPFLFPIMVNEAYKDAYPQIAIYMLGSVFNASAGLVSVVYTVRKKTSSIAKTTVAAGIINIAAQLLMINLFGLYAASVSTALAYAFLFFYRYFDAKKYYRYTIDTGTILFFVGMTVIVFAAFYCGQMIIQAGIFMFTALICFFMNRDTIEKMLNWAMNMLRKKEDEVRQK